MEAEGCLREGGPTDPDSLRYDPALARQPAIPFPTILRDTVVPPEWNPIRFAQLAMGFYNPSFVPVAHTHHFNRHNWERLGMEFTVKKHLDIQIKASGEFIFYFFITILLRLKAKLDLSLLVSQSCAKACSVERIEVLYIEGQKYCMSMILISYYYHNYLFVGEGLRVVGIGLEGRGTRRLDHFQAKTASRCQPGNSKISGHIWNRKRVRHRTG